MCGALSTLVRETFPLHRFKWPPPWLCSGSFIDAITSCMIVKTRRCILAGMINLATPTQQQRIYQFLRDNSDKVFFEGQTKELFPSGGGSYQDGGYWATPLDKILPFVARFNSTMACDLLSQVCIEIPGRALTSGY